MKIRCSFLLFLLFSTLARGASETASNSSQAIGKVLAQQAEAWNRGDLEGYMRGYWKSPELSFFSGGTITRGWQPTLERYRKRYQGPGRKMGRLNFEELSIDLLAKDAAVARGRWRLKTSSGKDAKGLFTLILRKFPEGWRIVHDHSSAE